MTYKGNRDNPKKRANKKVKADPKFSGGTTGEKFKPIPTGPFVTPDRDMRGQPIFERPQTQEEKDMTPIGGFGYKNLGRNTLKILKTAAALTQIPTTMLRTGLTISGIGGRM
tara:strand:- start:189 stop:524 length:336 start_codon:yes stop_codon:yes gene_type:complete